MSRTGSTCERRSPTSTGPRIRLALVAAVLLAGVGTARADWEVQTLTGVPGDVEVWTQDTYSVSRTSPQGALLMNTNGTVRDTHTGVSVGTFYDPATGCFASFDVVGSVVARPVDACSRRTSSPRSQASCAA